MPEAEINHATRLEKMKRERFTPALLAWFQKNKRRFPWRVRKASAYHVALAEALLQKTSATNALPIYQRAIEKYPTVDALAAAAVKDLAEMLQPLGLPRRALLLHQLANEIVKIGGKFPRTEAELKRLPGIGSYGAGAIASQAFRQRTPMIDINVMRIFHRVFSVKFTPRNGASKELREVVIEMMPLGKEADFNLGLLDFGALVCRARNPQHDICPLAEFCDYNIARISAAKNTD